MRCALREQDAAAGEEGRLTSFTDGNRKDEVILLNDDGVAGWVVSFGPATGDPVVPQPGDTVTVVLDKPFLTHDVYEFTLNREATDRRVPGRIWTKSRPYRIRTWWRIPGSRRTRTPRAAAAAAAFHPSAAEMHDTDIQHTGPDGGYDRARFTVPVDGTEIWDMLSKDELDIAYGVYIFHVDAGDLGQKIGKFAVIK